MIPGEPDPRPLGPDPAPHAADIGAPPSEPRLDHSSEAASAPGLAALHATLDRVVGAHGLRSLTVVVDDADLGRQAFRAGPGPFEPGALAGRPGYRADPALPAGSLDGELLVALCAASLRVDVLRGDGAEGSDAAELALRRLPGVHAVVVERDDDLLVVQVHAERDAPADLARDAARAAAPFAAIGGRRQLVVEVVRAFEASAPDAHPSEEGASAPSAPLPVAEIVAVRSVPESGEIEVHVRQGEMRTIGRAPMAQGLSGAVAATLDALHQHAPGLELGLAWARTIETTGDGRFVVAVALHRASTRATRHGLGAGTSPIEGAARGALDAAARTEPDDTRPPGP